MNEYDLGELIEADTVLVAVESAIEEKYMDWDVHITVTIQPLPVSEEPQLHWQSPVHLPDPVHESIHEDLKQIGVRVIDLYRQAEEFVRDTTKRSDDIFARTHLLMDELKRSE